MLPFVTPFYLLLLSILMKTFFFTTLFRLLALVGGWIYMSNFQSEVLYTFFSITNPATQAVNTCLSGIDIIKSGLNAKLDTIIQTLPSLNSTGTTTSITNGITTNLSNSGTDMTGSIRIIENSN